MVLESYIEAVKNRKTQKLFILIDDSFDLRFRVINPQGEVLFLPDALFEDDRVTVEADKYQNEFTPEQLSALERFNNQVAAQAREDNIIKTSEPEVSSPSPKKPSTPRKRSSESRPSRHGLGATWNSPNLTFYKHLIEPLHGKQTFKIKVDGSGEFEISKEDFLTIFNDVVMSPSYRSDGLFSYREIPEKARKYFKGA